MNKTQPKFLDYHHSTVFHADTTTLPGESWPDEWLKIVFKGYPRFDRLPLPTPQFLGTLPVHNIMQSRRSQRDFAEGEALTLEELSRVMSALRMTDGQDDAAHGSVRAYASAGGRYPIEAYVLPLNVESLNRCVHHYHVRSHSLEKLWSFSAEQFDECFPGDRWCLESGAAIILTACHKRISGKYGERAYRYCLLEAGQIAQNIQMLCTGEGLACCSYGAFVDDAVMRLIDVSPQEELVMHALFFGKPSRPTT